MGQWGLCAGLLGVAALAVSASAQAEGLRCGDRLASKGESLYEVRAKCGEPDDAQHTVESRTVPKRVLAPCLNGGGQRVCEVTVYQTVHISIDRWTYDFGSNRFIEFARFEDGSLVHVSSGGYGVKQPKGG
jgi:hypothetical protein